MTSVIVDPACTDDERRHALYSGDIFVHTHSPAIQAFVAFTRGMIEEAFDGRDPETAQHDMDVVEYAEVLAALKPAFIHHPDRRRTCGRSSSSTAATLSRRTSTCRGCAPPRPTTT